MRSPATITPDFFKEQDYSAVFISGSNLHQNARLYKYYWWIYPATSIYENAEKVFFKDEHKLSIKQAIDMMEKYKHDGIPFAYVNSKYYRLGNKIWDYESLKKKCSDIKYAPSYEDDMDEVYENGHK